MNDERIRDDISKGFADLTGLLEDAAGLAAEGQSSRCQIEDWEHFATLLWPEVMGIVRVLAATEQLITICQED